MENLPVRLTKKDLKAQIRKNLLELARRLAIPRRSAMKKDELVEALEGKEIARDTWREIFDPTASKEKKTAREKTGGEKATRGAAKKTTRKVRAEAPPARRRTSAEPAAASAPEPIATAPAPAPAPFSPSEAITASAYEVSYASAPAIEPAPDSALEIIERRLEQVPLPTTYGNDRLVLLMQSPTWAYAYWDLSKETRRRLARQGKPYLRIVATGEDGRSEVVVETPVSLDARSWYVRIPHFAPRLRAELGTGPTRRRRGAFRPALRSEEATAPGPLPRTRGRFSPDEYGAPSSTSFFR